MPFELPLPRRMKNQWKVKIQDKERLDEEPHVTIWRKKVRYRYSLRRQVFMDPQPNPRDVPDEILELVSENYEELCHQWDARFPTNPVAEEEEDGEEID